MSDLQPSRIKSFSKTFHKMLHNTFHKVVQNRTAPGRKFPDAETIAVWPTGPRTMLKGTSTAMERPKWRGPNDVFGFPFIILKAKRRANPKMHKTHIKRCAKTISDVFGSTRKLSGRTRKYNLESQKWYYLLSGSDSGRPES